MDHKTEARELFCAGYNCAQAVFTAFRDVMDLDKDVCLRLSSSFGGGMGRMRETCGAVTGMFMVAGYLWGYDDVTDESVITDHYALVQQLAAKFKEKHQTICCRELLESLSLTPGPAPTPRDAEFYKKRPCLLYVESAAEILENMISEK